MAVIGLCRKVVLALLAFRSNQFCGAALLVYQENPSFLFSSSADLPGINSAETPIFDLEQRFLDLFARIIKPKLTLWFLNTPSGHFHSHLSFRLGSKRANIDFSVVEEVSYRRTWRRNWTRGVLQCCGVRFGLNKLTNISFQKIAPSLHDRSLPRRAWR